jgi:hypothetical protein
MTKRLTSARSALAAALVVATALLVVPAVASAAGWTPTAIGLPAGATEDGSGGGSCPAVGECTVQLHAAAPVPGKNHKTKRSRH